MADRTCSIDGCEGVPNKAGGGARGWCGKHYCRWKRHGDPMGGHTHHGNPQAYFDEHITDVTDDCLLWPYGITGAGYGRLWIEGQPHGVHVLACERAHGPKPDGMQVCHAPHDVCGHRDCFNPSHVRWGTSKENHADRVSDSRSSAQAQSTA